MYGGAGALAAYRDRDSRLCVSQISFWEMAIKMNLGKLHIPIGLRETMIQTKRAGIEMLPVRNEHILTYETLPVLPDHKDPFDRFIISVALSENLHVLSNDKQFDAYEGLVRIWDE